jgi:putative membrane protein
VVIFAAAGASCFAQSQMNTNDPYNPQNQRLVNTQTNPPVNSAYPGSPNNIAPSILDMGSGTDQGNIGPFVTMADKQFARMTATRAMIELPLSQAAAEKGSTEQVRQLGRRMVEDYSIWSNSITRASARLKIELPAKLDEKHQAEVDRILALTGPAFDEAYLKEMVHLQDKALTVTHYEAENAGVTGFRNWAGIMIPTIQEELKLAKSGKSTAEVASVK